MHEFVLEVSGALEETEVPEEVRDRIIELIRDHLDRLYEEIKALKTERDLLKGGAILSLEHSDTDG